MKRFLLLLLLAVASFSLHAQSGRFGKDDLRWVLSDGVLTISGTGRIQSDDYPWTLYNQDIKTIIIGDNITYIGDLAFEGCSSLISIDIPNSVKYIGDMAFYDCSSLTSINIPNSVTYIGEWAFTNCDRLKEIYYPQGLDISKIGLMSSVKKFAYDSSNRPSQTKSPASPPLLKLVKNSLSFSEPSGNNRIDANEKCAIKFTVKNEGKGSAFNCEARIKLSGETSGIRVKDITLPEIPSGQTYEVSIPVTADISTKDGKVTFSIEVYEQSGWGIAPFDLIIATKAYESPYLQVVDYKVSSLSGKVQKMEPFTLTYTLQNTKYGDAEDVKVKISIPNNVIMMAGDIEMSFPLVKSGEKESAQIVLAANNNYEGSSIPITFDIKEKYGQYAENKELNIELLKTASAATEIIVKEEKTTYKIVSYKDMALAIAGTPSINILSNTSVSILRPEWYNKYYNPQNIKAPFPYAVIQLELKGDKEAIDLAKERLSLVMGGKHIVEAKDDKESNTIYFLVHCRNEYIDLDCGDGCEPINIWKERLEPNKVYHGSISVSVQ